MAHYAYLDAQNKVTAVIVGRDETDPPGNWEEYYGALRTSYNTRGGVYYIPNTDTPDPDQSKAFRKNYAGIGYIYDKVLDAFIPAKPYPSWLLDTNTCLWSAPVTYPNDGKMYVWDEATLSWTLVSP